MCRNFKECCDLVLFDAGVRCVHKAMYNFEKHGKLVFGTPSF